MSPPPDVLTFGCRLNTYESEVMKAHAAAAGWTDTVIVNTCAVTAEAERQARQAIRRIGRERPSARIVVTGCAAQIDPQRFGAMPEVAAVFGNAEKMRPETYTETLTDPEAQRIVVGDIMALRETAEHLVDGFDGRARAFVEIQQGCDHRCTFCIIPFGRGNNRSQPPERIIGQIRQLVATGYREVVLTGVDITGYGADLVPRLTLGSLVQRILAAVPSLERLRLSSLDPVEIDDALLGAMAGEPRLMPHFHLSVQSGNDLILKRMKRRHNRDDVLTVVRRIRDLRPDVAFGADLIVGFPTETDMMFEDTLSLVDAAGLTHLHVFPYSPRPGTPAARMPAVHGTIVKHRAARLRTTGTAAMERFLTSRVGATASILVEQAERGHCAHYLPVRLDRSATPGAVVTVRITGLASAAHGSGIRELHGTRLDD